MTVHTNGALIGLPPLEIGPSRSHSYIISNSAEHQSLLGILPSSVGEIRGDGLLKNVVLIGDAL